MTAAVQDNDDTSSLQLLHRRQRETEAAIQLASQEVPGEDTDERYVESPEVQLLHPGHRSVSHVWTSNVLFLVGSLLYVWLAVWDIRKEKDVEDDDDDDGEATTSPTSRSLLFAVPPYLLLSVGAALCYVFDAMLQLAIPPTTNGSESIEVSFSSSRHLFAFYGCGPFAVDFFLGATFGLGALLDLVSSLTVDLRNEKWTDLTAFAAVHSYLVNAILLLSGKRHSFQTLPDVLEVVGDLFFFTGSVVDVVLSYFYSETTSDATWKLVDRGNLVSAVLWLVDAMLCMVADYLVAEIYDADNHDEEEEETEEGQEEQMSVALCPTTNETN